MQEIDPPAAVVDSRLAAPMEAAPPVSWSDIPVELAGLVLGCLPAYADRVRFAAVCPQWRAAAQQGKVPPPMPMLLVPDGTMYSLPGSEPLRFPDCAGYADACGTGNWLVFSGEDGCFLRDPFSNATITLPALSRVRLQLVDDDEMVDEAGRVWMEMDEGEKLDASKIIFCSPHLIAAIFRLQGDLTGIAVCQPGATSWWSVRVSQWAYLFRDIVFHQGKLYALDSMDTLFAVDICVNNSTGDPCVSQIQEVIIGFLHYQYMLLPRLLIVKVPYLVESRGALLVVCRRIDLRLKPRLDRIEAVAAERNRFEVFEANFEQSSWAQVTTLGDDQVLFLRQRCCRSVSVSHKEVPRDCIFFLDNDVDVDDPHWHGWATSSSCSVYSMRDGKVSTTLPTVSWKHGTVFATWLFPQG
ncbi:unnamed protein product [Urochloa decumbens]|uniref:KIB1-4 beta-propeller domain-containing protein n=1 Tax=Urochloa decumbens TaxID=240449 RepID=A0ABC9B0Z1_9POAL